MLMLRHNRAGSPNRSSSSSATMRAPRSQTRSRIGRSHASVTSRNDDVGRGGCPRALDAWLQPTGEPRVLDRGGGSVVQSRPDRDEERAVRCSLRRGRW